MPACVARAQMPQAWLDIDIGDSDSHNSSNLQAYSNAVAFAAAVGEQVRTTQLQLGALHDLPAAPRTFLLHPPPPPHAAPHAARSTACPLHRKRTTPRASSCCRLGSMHAGRPVAAPARACMCTCARVHAATRPSEPLSMPCRSSTRPTPRGAAAGLCRAAGQSPSAPDASSLICSTKRQGGGGGAAAPPATVAHTCLARRAHVVRVHLRDHPPAQCPRTVANFTALCTGEKGLGKASKKPLHLKV